MARKHTALAKSKVLEYSEVLSTSIPIGATVYEVSTLPSPDTSKEYLFLTTSNKYYRLTAKKPTQYAENTNESGILMGEPAINVASGYECIFAHTYSPDSASGTNDGLSVYKPITESIQLNTGSMYTPTAQAVNNFVVPSYEIYTASEPSITMVENTVYRCTSEYGVDSITLDITNMVSGPKTRDSIVYFHTATRITPSLTITGDNLNTMYFGDTNLGSGMDYMVLVKNNSVFIINEGIQNYTFLSNKPLLDTSSTETLTPQTDETINGKISLHIVSKTGSYDDLVNKPTIPPFQVNSDWKSSSGASEILNKPTIPPAPGTLDTTNEDSLSTSASEALSGNVKLHKVSKTGDYNDLLYKIEAGDNILIRNTHLPMGYDELEYIRNSSSTRVNTGVSADVDNIKVELVVKPSSGVWRIFQSAGTTENACGFGGADASNNPITWIYRGYNIVTSSISRNTEHYMFLRATAANGSVELYVKDLETGNEATNTGTYTYGSIGYPTQFSLFGNVSGLYASSGNRVSSLKFWVNDVLRIDYVPCKRIQDNVVGFYNKVTGNLITKSTGTLNAGLLSKNNVINVTGLAGVATSGDYNDLTNKPTIPSPITIYSGSSAPTSNIGSDGDIYIQTTV